MLHELENLVPGYVVAAKLGEGSQAVVYKGFKRDNPGRRLVIKLIKTGSLSERQKVHFRQKIEQLKVLSNPMFITPLSFEVRGDLFFITRGYYPGITLDHWTNARLPLKFDDFFSVACQLAEGMGIMHNAGIIHGGIKPHNILINPRDLEIKLVDFITPLDIRDISHFIYDASFIRDTLVYTSPEQTGRIMHHVDFTTDFYSLGVVFYELLTGKLPFASGDPLELIHLHLAEEARDIRELNSSIPETLEKIIAKLLCKQPEKRYQSGEGLLADLRRCQKEISGVAAVGEFHPGTHDRPRRVVFISKMIGRDEEAGLILAEHAKSAEGAFRSLLISGLPGIGKTRLIQELQKPIVKHRGYFTSGKFDVYQKNLPYSSLLQALRKLIRVFLTESDERVVLWKKKILGALEGRGRILTDVLPELEVLIGSQPSVLPLPPVESRNRFRDIFGKFLASLASEENPLALFIDDLQWCDSATFDFFEYIFSTYSEYPFLFLIGAYRQNEVDSSHPLARLVRNAMERNFPLEEISLKPLTPRHCHEMVSYILDSPLEQTGVLSDFINDLTEGNPLFISESLSYLYNQNLLHLGANHAWQWDMARVRQTDMPATVVGLFGSKIQKLSEETRNLLERCACMGNNFSPSEVAIIEEMALLNVFLLLNPALSQGLLIESGDQLQFIHDRVQEAVLSGITPERRREIHWKIGTHLISAVPREADVETIDGFFNLFSVAAHLNLGRPAKLDDETAYHLSDINFHAGNKALSALATEAANEYFKLARELLPDGCWEKEYERTFEICQKFAKTELMCGNPENSELLLNQLLDHSKTDMDKADALAEQTTSLSSIGNFIKAIEAANRGLKFFDKAIPDDAQESDRRREVLMRKIAAWPADVWDTILNMPFTTDRARRVELAFYSELIPDLYMSGLVPQLYLAAAQSTLHCLEGGMDESVIYSFSIMGLQLGERGEFEEAFKYEDLARELSARYPNTFGATRGMNGIVWCNMHSRSHPREIADYSLKSIQCGKNCGDLYNAGLSYGPLMWNLQVQGANLPMIEEYSKECLQFSNKYHLSFSVGLAEAMQAGWIEPMKAQYAPVPMEEKVKEWEKNNHIASAGSYYVHLAITHYYFGEHDEAERCLLKVKQYMSGLTDNVLKRQWHVFVVLNSLKLYEMSAGFEGKEKLVAKIDPIIKQVETWAKFGPLLKPYLALVYAERERVLGNKREARSLFIDAISACRERQYVFLEGYLNECMGELLASEEMTLSPMYFVEAVRLYFKCGAVRKGLMLKERHPEVEGRLADIYPQLEPAGMRPPYILPNLDVDYLIKSSLAISAETNEEELFGKIMNVLLEGSGAQRGFYISEVGGKLVIRADTSIENNRVSKPGELRLEECSDVCHAIVRYAHRTGERVILDNASGEGAFRDDPQVQAMGLKSVLCIPALKQNKPIGIFYLENRLATSIFTLEKIQLTELIASQAAVSLENAKLVEGLKKAEEDLKKHKEQLEDMVEERSRELGRAQESLVAAERFAIMGKLAGSVAHEIRNPLGVIAASVFYVKNNIKDGDEKIRKHLDQIGKAVLDSASIIDSLLSLSGLKKPALKRVELPMVVDDIISAAQISPGILVVKDMSKKGVFVEIDMEQIALVFKNIIKNAVQAMEDHGTLTVRIEMKTEGHATITFIDTGAGISEENQGKIFQPLFTTKAQGIGLGLAICKMIVEKHGGTMAVKSKEKEGTAISVTLPSVR